MPKCWPTGPATTGPSSPPRVAAVIAEVSVRGRRSGGTPPVSQARPAVQDTADETPCARRTATSAGKVSATAFSATASVSRATPAIVTRRAPNRSASLPTGSEASSTAPE